MFLFFSVKAYIVKINIYYYYKQFIISINVIKNKVSNN